MQHQKKRLAVVLFNLGGPLENKDVRPFLYNLFSDRNIIDLPFGLRQFVAKIISSSREKSAQANYQLMGGGSPILAQTEAQSAALQTQLSASLKDVEVRTFIAMRYWHPFTEQAVAEIVSFEPDQIVLLPLYPQFSKTTTSSSIERFKAVYKGPAEVKALCCYPENPKFIASHVAEIREKLRYIKDLNKYRLLFSAHGLPEKIVTAGDPYQSQVEATVKAVMASLNLTIDHIVCYQSRVGPLKWIGPSTDDTIRETAAMGKNIVLVPIAFVSEHIETLVELDMEYAHLAREHGVSDYIRVKALGVCADFISGLCDEVVRAATAHEPSCSGYNCAASHKYCPRLKG